MKLATTRLPRFSPDWRPTRLAGQRVLVVGLGTFGGGEGAARFLLNRGAEVTITDLRSAGELGAQVAELQALGAKLVLGCHRPQDLDRAQWIVASPAVPLDSKFLQQAAGRGIPVETELSLLCRLLPCRWLGVTGTNGKSTTAMLAAHALGSLCTVFLGGNLGGSLLSKIDRIGARDLVVLEVSSFQLEHLAEIGISPDVGLITNVTEDHLDRHGTRDRYRRTKSALLKQARLAVLSAEDAETFRLGQGFPGQVLWFGKDRVPAGSTGCFIRASRIFLQTEGAVRSELAIDNFPLLGTHNRVNLAAAICAATHAFGAGFESATNACFDARPIDGRMNHVASVNGIRFVDDCVATSPYAVAAALSSMDGVIHLIAGGYDKGIDPAVLCSAILTGGTRAYLYGDSGPGLAVRLEAELSRCNLNMRQSVKTAATWQVHSDLASAFRSASRTAGPGETVLLSPGYASYDQFRNFQERGQLFRQLVRGLAAP